MTYGRDLQEDKEALFDATATARGALRALTVAVASLELRPQRALARAGRRIRHRHRPGGLPRPQGRPLPHRIRDGQAPRRRYCAASPRPWTTSPWRSSPLPPPLRRRRPPRHLRRAALTARDVPGGTAPQRVAAALAPPLLATPRPAPPGPPSPSSPPPREGVEGASLKSRAAPPASPQRIVIDHTQAPRDAAPLQHLHPLHPAQRAPLHVEQVVRAPLHQRPLRYVVGAGGGRSASKGSTTAGAPRRRPRPPPFQVERREGRVVQRGSPLRPHLQPDPAPPASSLPDRRVRGCAPVRRLLAGPRPGGQGDAPGAPAGAKMQRGRGALPPDPQLRRVPQAGLGAPLPRAQ